MKGLISDLPRLHMFMKMVEKTLHRFLFEINPSDFMRWHMNACVQTAILQAYFLRVYLPDPENWEIVVQECKFHAWSLFGNFERTYNHAHVYFEHKQIPTQKYILDTTRSDGYTGVQLVSDNDPVEAFLKGSVPGDLQLELKEVLQTIHWQNVFASGQTEYYSGERFDKIATILEAVLVGMNVMSSTPHV